MSQTTNLNVSPYFDDFDENDNYYKVLFKPGVPVQARELTGLQSILQNQIAKFGQHFFKEGSKVIPGNTTYIDNYKCVVINKEYLGIPVESYIDQLLNQKIFGATSGVSGTVVQIVKSADSVDGEIAIYIQYESQGIESADAVEFQNSENLITNIDILSGPENSTFIPAGEAFASTFSFDCVATGTAFSINEGVYFIRGNFVTVNSETIILDQYFVNPTGRIGLKIIEETINSDEDPNLTDNSKGFNNFAAPGADRLKISCRLAFKDIDDFNDNDFVELASVREGNLTTKTTTTEYNLIADELARRTFDESGDYITKPFSIKVRESANNGIGNNGVFPDGRHTPDGGIASEEIGLYQVSSGKAYVKGYEVNKQNTEFVDFDKPRTTKTLENQAITYNTGASLRLNRVLGSPEIGIGNTYIVSLRDTRTGSQSAANIMSAPGEEIGLARVYDFALESGTYNTSTPTANEWDISLYDIQTFTKITLNTNHTLSTPTFIKGKYSGATGFLRSAVSASTSLEVYETNGEFVPNEPLIFNGIENSRVSVAVTDFGIRDVKSIFGGPGLTDQNSGDVGFARTFTGDVKLRDEFVFGSANVTSSTGSGGSGISTITSGSEQFPGKVKVGNILKFGGLGKNTKTLAKVTAVSSTGVIVAGVTTVAGVAEGFLPLGTAGSSVEVSDLTLVSSPFEKSDDDTLFTPLPKPLISDVDLTDASLSIRKVFNVAISASSDAFTGVISAGDNETFLPFDEERYSLIRADGTIETLTDDKFTFTNGNKNLQISNIGADLTVNQEATLIATLSKGKPKAKVKRKNSTNSLVIDKSKLSGSGIGKTTLNDGLTFGSYPFGTRVQDEKISLNTPDVLDILGIFESTDTSDPSAPKMTLSSINTVDSGTTDLLLGEQVKGLTSGAIAIYTEQLTDSQISYVPLNESEFVEGESLLFENSNVQAIVNTIDVPSRNISADFTFNSGQSSTLFNHGFITRKSNVDAPTKKIRIYFSNAFFESDDTGDITTVNSYNDLDYKNDIQFINNFRNTDLIDIRPRVSNYTVTESNRSPLEFLGRSLNASGNSASNVLASDESITVDFSFYLGRIDKLYLTKSGRISWIPGTPAEVPDPPVATDDALELATITLPPYLFDVSEATMSFLKHRRYRMEDIRKLETRIKNLEYYSALTLLETATANLFVPDEDGLNKFKSGFFVDNFTTFQPQESEIPLKNSIDTTNKELRPSHYTTSIDLQVGPVEGETSIYTGAAPEGVNIRKTGDVITLDYDEKEYLKQPFGTRSESVTPFLLNFWEGFVKLTPSSDTWVNTVRLEENVFETEGNFEDVIRTAERRYGGFDTQTGLTPIVWGGWQTNWTGTRKESKVTKRKEVTGRSVTRKTSGNNWKDIQKTTTTTFQDTFTETFRDGIQSRDGSRQLITEQFDQTSLGDRTISTAIIPTIRSRNLAFDGKGFLPQSRMFAYFDGVDVTKYCVPKLIEIEMVSGSFQVGESVTGTIKTNPNLASDPPYIQLRVAVSNHKEGPHDAPTKRYLRNPYTDRQVSTLALESFGGNVGQILAGGGGSSSIIPSTYSSTSTLLNVDTMALANQPQGDFFGYIQTGMILKGGTSGAEAKITNVRLVVDFTSTVQGSFYIPNPNVNTNPVFQTGERDFVLTDDIDNDHEDCTTTGKDIYTASGSVQTVQENIVSVRNAKIVNLFTSEDRAVSESIGKTYMTEDLGSETQEKVIRYGRIKRGRRGGGGGKGGGCFMPGTLITLGDGSQKKIEEIEVGAKLLGNNNSINEVKEVLNVKTEGRKLANINDKGFFVTEDHPFMTKDGWKSCNKEMSNENYPDLEVNQLEIGDEIKIKDNKFEKITSIEFKEVDPDTDLHNFTLDGDQTYIANDYIVHNKGCFKPGTLMTLADGSEKKIEDIEVGTKLLGDNNVINEVKEILDVKADGRKLANINNKGFFVTEDHPFMTKDGWKSCNKEMSNENYSLLEVGQLQIGDEIKIKDNKFEKVTSIELKEVDPDTELHNFTLDGDNTYIANEYVAHNKGCFMPNTLMTLADGSEKKIEDIEVGTKLLGNNDVINEVKAVLNPKTNGRKLANINDKGFFVTEDHPFRTTHGWKSCNKEMSNENYPQLDIDQLEIGDWIKIKHNEFEKVTSIELKEVDPDTELHNFTLDGDHTYVANKYVAHNKCFMPGTLMTLADGSQKKIEEIEVGTKLLGDNNVINEVLVVLDAKTGGRKLANINNKGFFVTEDHPFMTKDGWKSCNKEMSNDKYSFLEVNQLEIGDEIKIKDNKFEKITSIELKEVDPDTNLHNFTLDGDHTYIANEYVSHNKGGGNGCFMPNTLMTLADGSKKKIEEIEVGNKLLGLFDTINEVKAILNPKTNGRKLVNINNKGFFVTEDHPFMTTNGWKSTNKEMSRENYPDLEVDQLEIGDEIRGKGNEVEKVFSIEFKEVDPDTDLHNLTLDGDHTYIANDLVAHNKRGGGRGNEKAGDPLAQSFFIKEEQGIFLTSCELFFERKDPNEIPVTIQIRTMKTGLPTTEVVPFSEVTLDPNEVNTSSNGSVPTKFTFESPVYLEGGTEYVVVVKSVSLKYKVFISRIGENDLITDEFVSNQPTLGSLFKSQNASTWEPSQWEDLKFILNRAEFVLEGTVELYNPILSRGNYQIPNLIPDALQTHSKKVRVGLSSAFGAGIHPTFGNTIYQQGSNVTGNLVGSAGAASGSLTVTKAGVGYTSSNASVASRDGDGHTVAGVALSAITGSGVNAVASVEYNEGSIVSATVTSGGQGYQVGDVLGVTTDLGINGRLSVVSIAATSELIIDNVQGVFLTGAGTTLMYGTEDGDVGSTKAGVGSAICGNGGSSGAFIPDGTVISVTDGLHITVNHKNHGMYHEQNLVTISDVTTDTIPTKLSVPYNNSSTDPITVDNIGILTSFENVSVAATNPGYIKIKNEIIKYTGVSAFSGQGTITGVTRAQDSTNAQNYVKGDLVQKYELGGVSLRRINRTHDFREVTDTNPIKLDSYKIKLNMGEQGIGRSTSTVTSYPALFLNQTKSTGGLDIRASQNMPFEIITPMIQNMTVADTTIEASIRTVSGTSINDGSGEGTDVPFVNKGTESISLDDINYFDSPRVIASRVNELNTATLDVLPGDRSFNMSLRLLSGDSLLSPVIDTQRMNAILTSNRIDNVIGDITIDSKVDTLLEDPSSAVYVSKENTLETSATSLKIIVDAHVNRYSDIRAFYAISNSQGTEPTFIPFPGYDNLDENGRVRTSDKSSGRPDALIAKSDPTGFTPEELEYKEYTFTANELPSFKTFRVKFLMTSTNQAFVPRLTSLKVIATA